MRSLGTALVISMATAKSTCNQQWRVVMALIVASPLSAGDDFNEINRRTIDAANRLRGPSPLSAYC